MWSDLDRLDVCLRPLDHQLHIGHTSTDQVVEQTRVDGLALFVVDAAGQTEADAATERVVACSGLGELEHRAVDAVAGLRYRSELGFGGRVAGAADRCPTQCSECCLNRPRRHRGRTPSTESRAARQQIPRRT
jgi:hypothetical protein